MLTFDVKIGNKILKMRMFENENHKAIVKKFCLDYGVGQ
jgi:hypothetical protein